MRLKHHGLEIELDSAWWVEAGMVDFVPTSRAYPVDSSAVGDHRIFEISIEDVHEVSRNPGVGVFNDNEQMSARERVLRILRGFNTGAKIPPVKVVYEPPESPYLYRLVCGAHRFYCSLAAGYPHVAAVEGFDIKTLDC